MVKSLRLSSVLLKVLSLQGNSKIWAPILSAMSSKMAEVVAAESIIAYVTMARPPAETQTGTMGRIAPSVTYAAASHCSDFLGCVKLSSWKIVWCRLWQLVHFAPSLHSWALCPFSKQLKQIPCVNTNCRLSRSVFF